MYDPTKRAAEHEKMLGDPKAELVGRLAATEETVVKLLKLAREKQPIKLVKILRALAVEIARHKRVRREMISYYRGYMSQLRDLDQFLLDG